MRRRNLVLQAMYEQGYLGIGGQADQALENEKRKPLNIPMTRCASSGAQSYPYFSDYVFYELRSRRYGLHLDETTGGNYYAESTIDPRLQQLAQLNLKQFLDGPAAGFGLKQGALMTIRPSTGEILAYVGGGDYKQSGYDRVRSYQQPGSTFKLFPFLAALEAGVRPEDSVSCAPFSMWPGCSHGAGSPDGTATVIDGFAFSENVIALRLAEKAGLDQVLKLARRLGITTPLEAEFNTVLGGQDTQLYELAAAYAVVANGGRSVPLHGVKRIIDLNICPSIVSLQNCPQSSITVPNLDDPRQLISPEVATEMDALLAAVVQRGTGAGAAVVSDARGKTGTTNDGVDVLFIGYSPSMDLLTAIWMGNDDNKPAKAASGALVAELWGRYMQQVAARG